MSQQDEFDVIIIGGSYSGLSAAMALGRALRKVLIIDSGKPCNRTAPHSHNFITQDGTPPAHIAQQAKDQVMKYTTVQFYEGLAVDAHKTETGFVVSTNTGSTFSAKKLLFATGLKDVMPPIPGFAECWGISIIHCPYCHGYEVKNEATGIIANGDVAYHYAWLISNWTKDLSLFTNEKSTLTKEQTLQLTTKNINIIEAEISSLNHEKGILKSISTKDGRKQNLSTIYARPEFEQHCPLPISLGCELNDQGFINVNLMQQTNIEGVYASGDNSSPMRAVAASVASGSIAGAAINNELSLAEFTL